MFSLQEVLHVDRKLYLVFEYLDQDLKKYMDVNGTTGLSPVVAKVCILRLRLIPKCYLLLEPVVPVAQWSGILSFSQGTS